MSAVVIGEALVDVVGRPDGGVSRHAGGSPSNVAFGLGRLGRPTTLVTRLGDDLDAATIRAHLAAAGVRVRDGGRRLDRTSTAVATIGDDGSASYAFDLTWELDEETTLPGEPLVVHTGSIAATLSPGAGVVERLVRNARAHSTVSYDPNIRPMVTASAADVRARVERLVAASDIVKASDEDVEWLAPGSSPVAVAHRWLELGPALVVVTLGPGGSVAVTRGGTVRVPAVPAEVADTVGAGDSYTAGLLDGLWSEGLLGAATRPELLAVERGRLRGVLEHAARAAAITVSRAGACPPTRAELGAYGPVAGGRAPGR